MSEAEREALGHVLGAHVEHVWAPTVERILASRDARLAAVEALADEKHEPPIDLIHERCPAGGVGPGRECTACSAAGRAYLVGVEHVQRDLRAALHPDPSDPA
jgi:hypothetical protein